MAKNTRDGEGSGGDTGFRGRRITTCSFCGKTSREVGPMVEGPSEVYVCSSCVDLCQNIFRQERRRLSSVTQALAEVRICLTRDLRLRDCAPDVRQDCPLPRVLMEKVR